MVTTSFVLVLLYRHPWGINWNREDARFATMELCEKARAEFQVNAMRHARYVCIEGEIRASDTEGGE